MNAHRQNDFPDRRQWAGGSRLALKVPPVAVGMVAGVLMWLTALAIPSLACNIPARRVISMALAFSGTAICLAGVAAFRRAKTTVNPMTPTSSSFLVKTGVYRYTRNPMYLGFLLMLAAWGVSLANLSAVVWLAAFVTYMNCFQIAPEEQTLSNLFDPEFAEYRARVRRWI